MTQQATPREFFNDAVNAANANIKQASNLARTGHGGLELEAALKIAAIQAELAKAAGLAVIAEAIYACSTPGDSIRYGLRDVASALRGDDNPARDI